MISPDLVARASIPLELDWVLSAAHKRTELYEDQSLAEEVRSLWGPDESLSYHGYLEISAMAQAAGLLFTTDSDEFLARLDEMCRTAPSGLPFLAETAADRGAIERRLSILRGSPARRGRYVDVLSRVWSGVRDRWEREGLPAVQAQIVLTQAQIDRQADWRDFTAEICPTCTSPEVVFEAVGPGTEIAVVPAYFSGKGLLIDLPGVVMIGVGVSDAADRDRSETESLARRLKALADPTRLTILRGIAARPMTITEVAQRYSLAQPTVSNHIKLLREAGFVGRGRTLDVVPQALEDITVMVKQLISPGGAGRPPSTGPRGPGPGGTSTGSAAARPPRGPLRVPAG